MMADPTTTPRIARTATRRQAGRALRLTATGGTIADRVVAVLVDHIRRHRLPAGSPLPSEIQTSAQLQVSRGVVREAYRSLSSTGLVEIANGRSPRVGYISNRSLTQLVQHALWTEQASAEQILELRSSIEERAAELAATHRSGADVDALHRAVAGMRASVTRTEPYVKADIRFHEIIGRATGNPLFALVSSALREAMGTSIRASLAGRKSRAELNNAIETHAKIVDAIEARSSRDARRLMVRHFAEARTAVRRLAAAAAKSGGAPPRPRRARTA
jgi:DNA-binding FadR family transcriptional regulator